jgi:phosphate transport system substrate-binding protein
MVKNHQADIEDDRVSAPTAQTFPRIDGSTSTEPLNAMVACKVLDVTCHWLDGLFGERRVYPELTGYEGSGLRLAHSGTHGSYVNLIKGEADLILVARTPASGEAQAARAAGVELEIAPIAHDAFVFIVNESNVVRDLTGDQLRSVFAGDITDWSELGGPVAEIHPYQRNEESGSQELMRRLVMRGRAMVDLPQLVVPTMAAPFYAVSSDTLGIGYSVYYYEANMAPRERVRLVAVNGVLPDTASIRSKRYPFVSDVYAVILGNQGADSNARWLWHWLLSLEGQAVVAASGYVPLNQ